jgi:hypothetical protein
LAKKVEKWPKTGPKWLKTGENAQKYGLCDVLGVELGDFLWGGWVWVKNVVLLAGGAAGDVNRRLLAKGGKWGQGMTP